MSKPVDYVEYVKKVEEVAKVLGEVLVGGLDYTVDSITAYGINPSTGDKEPIPVRSGKIPIAIDEDNVNIAKSGDIQLLQTAIEELHKIIAYNYDYMVRRSGGRLLATIDFTLKKPEYPIDEFDTGYVAVQGDYASYSIVKWSDEGIPQPEGAGSPYVLKIVVKASGTVYVRVPIKASYFKPFSAYITLYSKDYDVYVSAYATLGGILNSHRNKLPKPLYLPANSWGRLIIHWFMEAHHGCGEVDIEISNPHNVDVIVYIGMVTADEISPHIKGFCLIFGWEGTFELVVNNETLKMWIDIMIPTDVKPVAHMAIGYGIAGDGTNPLSIDIKIHPGGATLVSDSQTDTSYKYVDKPFKVFMNKMNVFGHPTFSLEVTLTTSGSGKLGKFIVVLYALSDEYTYQKHVEATISGGQTTDLLNLSNDTRHIAGGYLEIGAPSDGSVDILADTPEGEIVICSVPPNATKIVEIRGRYTYIKARNNGTSNATIRGAILVSDAYLLR